MKKDKVYITLSKLQETLEQSTEQKTMPILSILITLYSILIVVGFAALLVLYLPFLLIDLLIVYLRINNDKNN